MSQNVNIVSQNVSILKSDSPFFITSSISPCGNYIATTGYNGRNILIYKITFDLKITLTKYIRTFLNYKIYSIKWFYDNNLVEPNSLRIITGSKEGYPQLQIWNPLKKRNILMGLLSGSTDLQKTLRCGSYMSSLDIKKNLVIYSTISDRRSDIIINAIIIHDLNNYNLPREIQTSKFKISSVAFSPDGNKIVSGSYDNFVRIWKPNLSNSLFLHLLCRLIAEEAEFILVGHTEEVETVAWSRDGNYIVSGSRDKTVIIWNATNGNIKFRLTGHTGAVTSVAFSPDGKYIVSGSIDKSARVWDTNNGELIKTMANHKYPVLSVSWESYIVSNSDRELIIWDFLNLKKKFNSKNYSYPKRIPGNIGYMGNNNL